MPPTNRTSAGIQPLLDQINGLKQQLSALQTQQTQVVTDPSGATGDPAHGHAVLVIGNLLPITGIAAFGEAVYIDGHWQRIDDGLRVLRGVVDGATGNLSAGTGVTTARLGTGFYRVTFTVPFTLAPMPALLSNGSPPVVIRLNAWTTTLIEYQCFNLASTAVDATVWFTLTEG